MVSHRRTRCLQDGLTEEQPPPGGMAEDPLHVGQHAGTHKGGEGIGDEVAAKQEGVPGGQLAPGVPLGEDEEGAGKEGRLDKAEEEADNDHAGKVVHDPREGRDQSPQHHRAPNVEGRPRHQVDGHIGRDLHEDVAHIQDREASGISDRVLRLERETEKVGGRGGHYWL